jgi:peptidoglycan hydrolase CwlO-like protein
VREFLAGQRHRLQAAQQELAERIERITAEVAHDRQENDSNRREIEVRREELRQVEESIQRLKSDWQDRRDEWERAHQQSVEYYQTLAGQVQTRQEDLLARQEALQQRQTEFDTAALARLQEERDRLVTRLSELESRPTRRDDDAGEGRDSEANEVRELRSRNRELQRQLAEPKAGGAEASGRLDWESEKQRIMAALEAETDDDSPEDRQHRLEVRDVVRRTERILAEKELELDELKLVLEQQSNNLGDVAVGAAAIGDLLDSDEIIREERENLCRMKEQWEQKLREAEIETSIERAKIARQRAELEERVKELEKTTSQAPADPSATQPPSDRIAGGKPGRGRWLTRLGLKDHDAS